MSDSPAFHEKHKHKPAAFVTRVIMWIFAITIAAGAMIYQRATGPTHPKKGPASVDGNKFRYELIRTHETTGGAVVTIPRWDQDAEATLHWRRFPTSDEYTAVDMEPVPLADPEADPLLSAMLPVQPSAGKIEYYIEAGDVRLPVADKDASGEPETVVLRYKDPVPDSVLIPHVTLMILTIIFGTRAMLAALFTPASMRVYTWLAFVCMTAGGMVLGPIVQKHAFGEYWTGFPFESDWTDNKTLVMWGAWIVAVSIIGFRAKKREFFPRLTVAVAYVAMMVAYLIPHSMGGSQLDYDALDKGLDPKEAIRTGKQE